MVSCESNGTARPHKYWCWEVAGGSDRRRGGGEILSTCTVPATCPLPGPPSSHIPPVLCRVPGGIFGVFLSLSKTVSVWTEDFPSLITLHKKALAENGIGMSQRFHGADPPDCSTSHCTLLPKHFGPRSTKWRDQNELCDLPPLC